MTFIFPSPFLQVSATWLLARLSKCLTNFLFNYYDLQATDLVAATFLSSLYSHMPSATDARQSSLLLQLFARQCPS